MAKVKKLTRELHNPLTDEEAASLNDVEKEWLRSWNRQDEIPGEEPDDDDDDEDDEESSDYSDMSNDELRAELKSRDLPSSGNKDEMIARLEEDDDSEE